MPQRPVRVLIVDDSALARKFLIRLLAPHPDIEVVGTASDPYLARDPIRQLKPDVITLDMEMPKMDGLTFLKILMTHHPLPVIVISSITDHGSQLALEALRSGAVDVMHKPDGPQSAVEDGETLADKIRSAAACQSLRKWTPPPCTNTHSWNHRTIAPRTGRLVSQGRRYSPAQLIAIGSSTGGTEALKTIFESLPEDLPGIAVVQHIPAFFSRTFAERLNQVSSLQVAEAAHGSRLLPGTALVAPGGSHMTLKWVDSGYVACLNQSPKLHFQRPAVDALFQSIVSQGNPASCLGIILTGMGSDGAVGLLQLRQLGAETIAQDEASSVVFGMPREAIARGAAHFVLPLHKIAEQIDTLASRVALSAALS